MTRTYQLADIADIEKSRQREQEQLDRDRSLPERNRLGQFATASGLANQMAETIQWLRLDLGISDPIHFIEPSIGTGALYSAFLHTFADDAIASTVGFEIDPSVVAVAARLWMDTDLQIIEGDFTSLQPSAQFNLLLANPPYVRHHHLSVTQKAQLQQSVQTRTNYKINGLAGLYCYFILLADAWLATNALAAWLIPTEFMDVNYGEVLRHYLTEQVTLLRIHCADSADLQFDDALVSSAIIFYQKAPPPPDHTIHLTGGGSLLNPATATQISVKQLGAKRKWTPLFDTKINPLANSTVGNASPTVSHSDISCLADFFEIKRGIATGANDFFIMTRVEAQQRNLPGSFLRPILPSPRHLHEPLILSDASGFPQLPTQHVLIDCHLPYEQVRDNYPTLADYFAYGEAQGLHTRYLTTKRTPWYRQEQRQIAPFLCSYMGRNLKDRGPFRFFWNQSQALAPNVYLLLYPRSMLAEHLRKDSDYYAEIFARLQAIDFTAMSNEGRIYGGALHKIEPRELGRVAFNGLDISVTRQPQLF